MKKTSSSPRRALAWLAVVGILLGGAEASSPTRLRFVKKIGISWREGEENWMGFVAFNAEGNAVAADGLGHDDSQGAIWSFPEGEQRRVLPHTPRAICRDFRYYAWAQGYGEVESGRTLFTLPENEWGAFTFSSDCRFVVHTRSAARGGEPRIHVSDLATGTDASRFGTHVTFALAISPDNRTVASGYWDMIALWDVLSGRRIAVLRGMNRYVRSLAFSSDGRRLAAGSDTGTVGLWDLAKRSRIWSTELGGGYVSTPSFSSDGSLIAVGVYGTGTVSLLDAGTGGVVDHTKVSDLGCGEVAFSPDGRFLITTSSGGLIKWPPDFGGTVRVFEVKPR